MTILKWVLGVIVALTAVLLRAGMALSPKFQVSRSVTINAPADSGCGRRVRAGPLWHSAQLRLHGRPPFTSFTPSTLFMPLVHPLPTDHDPEVERLAQFFNTTLGFPPHSVLTMMRRPALARAFTELNRAVMADEGAATRVTGELKRLIGHIASRAAGCRYCEAHTIRAAARFGAQQGAAPARLDEVWTFRTSPLFSSAERAALEYAAAAASVPGAVTPEIGTELRRHWDDGEIVDITGVIALFGFLNRWNDAMATELEAPAAADGMRWLAPQGWTAGKHVGLDAGLEAGLQRGAT